MNMKQMLRAAKQREPAKMLPASGTAVGVEALGGGAVIEVPVDLLCPGVVPSYPVQVGGETKQCIARTKDVLCPRAGAALLDLFSSEMRDRWVSLRGRRVLRLGGEVTPSGLIQEDLPLLLQRLALQVGERFFPEGVVPNHVLVNAYEPGDGILPHVDGPAYCPFVVILSLQSCVGFDFFQKTSEAEDFSSLASVLLPAYSALTFTDEAYTEWAHGIIARTTDEVTAIEAEELFTGPEEIVQQRLGASTHFRDHGLLKRGKRISLTIRYVPPIAAAGSHDGSAGEVVGTSS